MSRHHFGRDAWRLRALAAAIVLGFAAAPAEAQLASANAGDMSVHIDVLGGAQLDVDPQAPAGFSNASAATDQQNSLPSIDRGNALLHLTTANVSSQAEYAPGVSLSFAASENDIQNFNLSAVSLLGDGLLSMHADAIKSQSTVGGYCLPAGRQRNDLLGDDLAFYNGFDNGNLVPGGGPGGPGTGVTFQGLGMSILGVPIPDLPTDPAPNTAVDLGALGITGATLVLNEQAITGDGVNSSALSTNAIHLTMNESGLVTADVAVGHSDSMLDCTESQ